MLVEQVILSLIPDTATVMQSIGDLAAYTVNAVIDRIEGHQVLKDEIFLDVYLRNGETT
jgi:hypothetical protein